MAVYDAFLISNELDMALLRMHILKDVVDYHVVCEAHETHSGKPRSLNFRDNIHRFEEFHDKIIYVYVPTLSDGKRDSWEREKFHRDNISRGLGNARPDDLVIVSDCDEIPNPDSVLDWKTSGVDCAEFDWRKHFYYYKLNFKIIGEGWSFGGCKWSIQNDANGIKSGAFGEHRANMRKYPDGAWHFSFFHDAKGVRDKLQSFMHHDIAERDARLNDVAYIEWAMKNGVDLFKDAMGRRIEIERLPGLEKSLPRYLLDHLDEYRQWIAQ